MNGWQRALKSGAGATKQTLWTEAEFGDAEFTLDVKPGKDASEAVVTVEVAEGVDPSAANARKCGGRPRGGEAGRPARGRLIHGEDRAPPRPVRAA